QRRQPRRLSALHQPPPRSLSNRLRKVGRGSGGSGGAAGTPTCVAVHLSSCSTAPSSASVAAMSRPSRPGHSYGLGEQAASGPPPGWDEFARTSDFAAAL